MEEAQNKDMSNQIFRVLLAEDDDACRERFETAIRARPELELAASFSTVKESKAALGKIKPDVIVVDIGLPDGSGIDIIRTARSYCSKVKCLVVTVYGDEQHVFDALAAGATGYLQKDAPLSEVGEAVVSATEGGVPVSPSIAKALLKYLSAPSPSESNTEYYLTDRETDVLRLIARGYSREEISNKLNISLNTVSAHTKNIYRKLEVHSGTGAIDKARKAGLI
jgi:DNA-binding NarL/FixJ family response regulator